MNTEIYNYHKHHGLEQSGHNDEWLERKGYHLRAHPQLFRLVDDGQYTRAEANKHAAI